MRSRLRKRILAEEWEKQDRVSGTLDETPERLGMCSHAGAWERVGANIILVDVGPNLGAINRSALIASDYVIIPLGADLFSLQGLKNLGPVLRSWRNLWKKRIDNWLDPDFSLPQGRTKPLGYIVQQHSVRLSRPVKAYDKWVNRMPTVYHETVLQEPTEAAKPSQDKECLATLKHYRSLIPILMKISCLWILWLLGGGHVPDIPGFL